jgi:glycerol-3-phosphate acyltransferase PlsY
MVAAVLALLVIARHGTNIVRLWQGTEPRIGGRKG